MANYKNLDIISSLKISKPQKVSGSYQSNTSFKVQTPEVTVDLDNKTISFRMIKKGKFVTLLEELENKIVSTIYNNSTDFFNGKTFPENRIRNSLQKLFTLDNEGIVTLNNITIPDNLKVYDHFNEVVPSGTNGKVSGVCILQLDTIKFVKTSINVGFTLTHLKLSVEKKKLRECILDDEPENVENLETEEEPVEKITEIVKETTLTEEEPVEKSEETIDETIDPEVNTNEEYADFFEE